MQTIVLNPIKITYDIKKMERLKDFPEESSIYQTIKEIIFKTPQVIKPKAMIKKCAVSVPKRDVVVVEGHTFDSRLVFEKLFHSKEIFIIFVTSSDELDAVTSNYPKRVVETLKYGILNKARNAVANYICNEFKCQDIAELNPGSLPDWPIEENYALGNIIGELNKIGMVLKKDGFMEPLNSVSGILYSGDKGFINCSLCKKHACIGRKAPFNEKEYQRIFK